MAKMFAVAILDKKMKWENRKYNLSRVVRTVTMISLGMFLLEIYGSNANSFSNDKVSITTYFFSASMWTN
jgi:hypothetical protein